MHQVQLSVAAYVQRTNGRIAMIAFAGAAAAEVATGQSILEQAAASPVFITFMVLLLTVAGFMPKLASGVSLSRLIDAAGNSWRKDIVGTWVWDHSCLCLAPAVLTWYALCRS